MYREFDDGYLPPHLRLHGLATSIHQNAMNCIRDIVSPCTRRLDGRSLIQDVPMVYCFDQNTRDAHPSQGFHNSSTGDMRRDTRCAEQHRHESRGSRHPRGQSRLARPDRNRRPFLPDVQCDAWKRVGHVAKHCNMLATAICLERYMKKDLSVAVRDTIKRDWLTRWKDRLGNPDTTPRQVLRAYVEDLDITVARLDEEMDWQCWADEDDNEDTDE
jgi:hypothetical protein